MGIRRTFKRASNLVTMATNPDGTADIIAFRWDGVPDYVTNVVFDNGRFQVLSQYAQAILWVGPDDLVGVFEYTPVQDNSPKIQIVKTVDQLLSTSKGDATSDALTTEPAYRVSGIIDNEDGTYTIGTISDLGDFYQFTVPTGALITTFI